MAFNAVRGANYGEVEVVGDGGGTISDRLRGGFKEQGGETVVGGRYDKREAARPGTAQERVREGKDSGGGKG